MISEALKLIFIHIPRTGGTSIELALVKKNWWVVDSATKHIDWRAAKRRYAAHWDDYLKFAVVRNPWDWLVSLYSSHDRVRARMGAGREQSWPEFVRNPRLAAHEQDTLVQSQIIGPEIDFVLHYERLGADFRQLCERAGIAGVKLPHFRANSGRDGRPFQEHYTKELQAIVAERHAEDIERFGYTFAGAPV